MNKKVATKKQKKRPLHHNLRPSVILLLIPVITGIAVAWYIVSNNYQTLIAGFGSQRLTTEGWEKADDYFTSNMPSFERKFAYYQVKESQSLTDVAEHFSIPLDELAKLNPGTIAAGTTIKVPPIKNRLAPIKSSNNLQQLIITEEADGIIRLRNDYAFNTVNTTLPELASFLSSYNVLTKLSGDKWRLERPLILEENIRIDIRAPEVTLLQLRSSPNQNITCLCLENATALIEGVEITTYDPTTEDYDTDFTDGRSFIRALDSSRMDIINSNITYLGNELQKADNADKPQLQRSGGTYGVSWRVSKGTLGEHIATGWVEGNRFYKNHFGSYTFGASGMVWKGNHYLENDVYGLDPHDDSNNALIEDNIFEKNGTHGFIVSKRCNYNIIRNNTSFNNGLHGFMLHQDSVYNVIENNLSYNNVDNFAIYASNNNMIRNNVSRDAKGSHVRINENTQNTYVMNNEFIRGSKGIYIYGKSNNTYISGNSFRETNELLATNGGDSILFTNNTVDGLRYSVSSDDRVVFGPNYIKN